MIRIKFLTLSIILIVSFLWVSPITISQVFGELHPGISLIKMAFSQAFDGSSLKDEQITKMHGGVSGAYLFKIDNDGQSYVARIGSGKISGSIENEILAAQTASLASYGPDLYYSDPATGMIIARHITNDHKIDRLSSAFHVRAASALKLLHQQSVPLTKKTLFQFLDEVEADIQVSGYVLPFWSEEEQFFYEQQKNTLQRIFEKYRCNVPIHHDLNSFNILANQDEVKLIDWETVSVGDDPAVDLAIFSNFHIFDETLVLPFLQSYYGRKPTKEELAKFTVMRPMGYMLHALWIAKIAGLNSVPDTMPKFEYVVYEAKIKTREIDLRQKPNQLGIAFSTILEALRLMRTQEFADAVELLSNLPSQ